MNINQNLLEALFMPFAATAEEDDDQLNCIHGESDWKEAIKEHIGFTPDSREILKATLAFYIRKADFDAERFWNSLLPSFDAPKPARAFLLWTWETLFPNEQWMDCHVESLERLGPTSQMLQRMKDAA
jgi:hypothetical protein